MRNWRPPREGVFACLPRTRTIGRRFGGAARLATNGVQLSIMSAIMTRGALSARTAVGHRCQSPTHRLRLSSSAACACLTRTRATRRRCMQICSASKFAALRGRPRVARHWSKSAAVAGGARCARKQRIGGRATIDAPPSAHDHLTDRARRFLSRPRTIESPLGSSCSAMGDLHAERALATPVGRGCSRLTLTLTDACSIAAERGGVCLSDTYVGSRALMRWRCGAGHEWSATFSNVRNSNTWCPQCAGVAPLSLADAQAAAAKRGGVCLSDKYTNCRTPLRWRCGAGHEWSAPFYTIRAQGSWCPQCVDHSWARLSLADAQAAAAKLGGVCLSDTYANNKTPLMWRCGAGHEWRTTLSKIRNGRRWCPQCARRCRTSLSIADAQSAAAERGGVCLSDTYSNCMTPLRWRCAAGHEWSATFNNVRTHGSWCPQCAGVAPLSLADAQAAAVKLGGECLSDAYSNSKTPLRWRCAAGHEWRAPLVKIRSCRRWCPLCAKAANRRQRNHRRAAKHA
jgi:hypothetical protein